MFRGWKCAEGGTEISPFVRQHGAPGRSANEQEEGMQGVSLLLWGNAFPCSYTARSLKPCEKACGNVR